MGEIDGEIVIVMPPRLGDVSEPNWGSLAV